MSTLQKCCSSNDLFYVSNTKLMSLVYSSDVGAKFNLSSSALVVLLSLCYHYNSERNDSFPGQQLISKKTGVSLSSVKRSIKELLERGIIIKSRNKYGNLYKFTQKFFDELELTSEKAQIRTSSSVKKNFAMKKQTKEQLKLIKPNFKQDFTVVSNLNTFKESTQQDGQYQKFIKHNFWEHIPTGKLFKSIPDIGNHVLFRLNLSYQTITFTDDNFTDNIMNFKPVTKTEFKKKIQINNKKPSKQALLKNILNTGNNLQAKELAKLWKIQI